MIRKIAELEDALLRIAPFPRRALLLTVFEQLSGEDARMLLNGGRECVKTATAIGLFESSRNLMHSIPRTSSNHHSVTTWAQRRHDSDPLLSVF